MFGTGLVARVKRQVRKYLPGAVSVGSTIVDPTPLSAANRYSSEAVQVLEEQCRRMNVRILPYPFDGMLSLASDTDGASRADYEFYNKRFVEEAGLDFGDSTRLSDSPVGDFPGMKIFGWNAELPPKGCYRPEADGLTFHETVREIYLGSVDHFHGLMNSGPKLVRLATSPIFTDRIELPETDSFTAGGIHGARPMPVLGILLHRSSCEPVGLASINVELRNGEIRRYGLVADEAMGRWQPRLWSSGQATLYHLEDTDVARPPPTVGEIAGIVWGKGPTDITYVGLVNNHRVAILSMLRQLRDGYRIGFSTLTDCTAFAFAAHASGLNHGNRNLEALKRNEIPARYGRLVTDEDFHACYVDDPESFAYAIPELRETSGLRFINPAGWTGEVGADISVLNLIVPGTTRDGGRIYVARRCVPEFSKSDNEDIDPNNQGTLTIAPRLQALFDRFKSLEPGLAWTVYTHLGNLRPKPVLAEDRIEYFPDRLMHCIQDSAFGISRDGRDSRRMMFTRASLSYEYSMLLRGLVEHPENLTRTDDGCISLASWMEPVLEHPFPDTPNRLNGLTFYVDDPSRTILKLDNVPVPWIARNAPDKSGRPSITAIGIGTLHDLIHRDLSIEDAEGCRLETATDPIQIVLNNRNGVLSIDASGMNPLGAQHLLLHAERSDALLEFCVEIETTTGGCFRFFDRRPIKPDAWSGRPDAEYYPEDGIGNRPVVAPLWNMRWHSDSVPGGPMPNHPVRRLTIRTCGPVGATLRLHEIMFNRPDVRPLPERGTRVPIGGRCLLENGEDPTGRTVEALVEFDGDTVRYEVPVVNQQGWFEFSGIPCGAWIRVKSGSLKRPGFLVRRPDFALHLAAGGDKV